MNLDFSRNDVAYEKAPFLDSDEEEKGSETSSSVGHVRGSPPKVLPSVINIVLVLLLVLTNAAWWAAGAKHKVSTKEAMSVARPQLVWSPATETIEYERVVLNRSIETDNVFAGERTPAMEEAWADLIKPMALKLSKEEVERVGLTSLTGKDTISFKDGSGYLAEMGVYHELHCVKHLREHLYRDFKHMPEHEYKRERIHVDHCLEYFREQAMCRGDSTIAFFVWNSGIPKSTKDTTNECVKWGPLNAWAESRMVTLDKEYTALNKD
ncbi:unnamed protein product [Periconia digitata]|uniref:Uncharacterized protein n=1 Tax=Periconia digitata TaxID=1303443 RepID=A0A9W4XI48_9PLEO|nr:unnamed protein product [Periconia digitata]